MLVSLSARAKRTPPLLSPKPVKPGTSALSLQPEAFRILRECPKTMKMLYGFV